ncbi:hypothetical protein SAMN05216275_105202 [Streptosporangium canum]|uniref:Uncharacterized protein n=1 Tax=Streptosporangium canum TaxID=324952 RepID=A0A1I3LMV2_9ACTN|nr:hypothetical protein SAMN05216275_105202 [Streptosporangium canum]
MVKARRGVPAHAARTSRPGMRPGGRSRPAPAPRERADPAARRTRPPAAAEHRADRQRPAAKAASIPDLSTDTEHLTAMIIQTMGNALTIA